MTAAVSRRHLLQLAAGGVVATQTQIAADAATASLGDIAAAHGFLFGAAAGPVIETDAAYRELYIAQTRIITTDVALKMARIAAQPGPKRFEGADRLLAFSNAHRIPMRGHCLIWNEWVPAWIKSMSTSERQHYFDSYIEEVVARYAGRLHSWDIVNEPFWPGHHAPGDFRVGPWYDAFGPDYIRRAYKRAANIDSTAKFVLNEAQTERDDALGLAVRKGLLKLVADLKQADVRLDVVGLEAHLQPQYPHNPARFSEFINALAALGVDVYLTEFDVRDDTFPDDIEARDKAVARTAGQFLEQTLDHPAVKALITWELADNYSFYRGIALQKNPSAARLPRPLPYDERLQRKPMWQALAHAFETAGRREPYTSGRAPL